MTAVLHILMGPRRSGKTERLLGRAVESADGARSVIWLVPTRRHADALLARIQDETRTALAGAVTTFHDFTAAILAAGEAAVQPLSRAQRGLLLDDILTTARQREKLRHYQRVFETRGFRERLAGCFDELCRAGVGAARLAEAVAKAHQSDPESLQKAGELAWLHAAYNDLLISHRLVDFEGRLTHATAFLKTGPAKRFEQLRGVFVDGFSELTRAQEQLLLAIAPHAEEMWIALPDEPTNGRAEMYSSARAARDALVTAYGAIRAEVRVEHVSPSSDPSWPAALTHVDQQLFQPVRAVVRSPDAEGIELLEAPGILGEVRLVARRIKSLLLELVAADDILVTMRDVAPYADLLREVFGEYGIPIDMEGTDPLARNPAVRTLLRALRLPEEDWPFAGVTMLLRSGYFCPDWPETQSDSEIAQRAEVLLRMLEAPRGREVYLTAVRRWAENVLPGLEDEQAEESRRQTTHQLAKQCRPFLERFFTSWDAAPALAPLSEHLAWLRAFTADLGLERTSDPRDAAAFQRLWNELEQWQRLETTIRDARSRSRKEFLAGLWTLASEIGMARTPRGPGRVRVLGAETARTLTAEHVFLLGLGERGFPRLTAPDLTLDETERQALRRAGLALPTAADSLPGEMHLFHEVVTSARRRLVLSYPAVDDTGQAMLPSSFLAALLECFEPNAIPRERRAMLIEDFDRVRPLAPSEYRVQAALELRDGRLGALPRDLEANLVAAERLHRQRLLTPEFGPYDGSFRDPAVLGALQQLYGPQKVFSPTALEEYVACPFRFFLGNVLKLQSIDDPREEIEVTRRGQAFHRALARMHQELRARGIEQATEEVEPQLRERLGEAVTEYAARAGSPASKKLWEIEGERLQRLAPRYGTHWRKFVEPWLEPETLPRPFAFEVDFGLPTTADKPPLGPLVIRHEGTEVRVSGRIDRIDTAELEDGLGFWIIDYKTGRGANFTSTDLEQFRKLQLTLYALAVEQVVLAGQNARPLGLVYWLVGEKGPKVVLPTKQKLLWFEETKPWREVREELQQWVATLAANIRQGVFPLKPRSVDCTQTCDFGQICRITQSRHVVKNWELALPGERAAMPQEDESAHV